MFNKAQLCPRKGHKKREDELRRILLPRLLLKWRRAFGVRLLMTCTLYLCNMGKFRKLAKCLLLAEVIVFFLAMYYFAKFLPVQSGWFPPDSCVAKDCIVTRPLPLSKLPPNFLLVLIHTSVEERSRREAIRKTWASTLNNHPTSPVQYR